MNYLTTVYNKILEGIEYIRDFAESTQKFIDTISAIVQGVYLFLKPIFSWIPWEVLLLLAVTIFFLSWINGLFPSTPKLNYTLIVLFLCSAWAYVESVAYPEEGASWGRILRASLYLLLPVLILGILGFLGRFLGRWIQRKWESRNLDSFLEAYERESRRLLATGYSVLAGDREAEEFRKQIQAIQALLDSIKLESKKVKESQEN